MKIVKASELWSASHRRRRGTAAAEFALMLVPLTLLLLGTVDFCRLFYYHITISNCARNGAIWASDPYSNPDFGIVTTTPSPGTTWSPYTTVLAAAQLDAAGSNVTLASSDVVITYPVGGAKLNSNVTVTVSHSFTLLTRYVLGTNAITLGRSVTMLASPTVPN